MITVRKHIVTETAHRLLEYPGNCAHVHGHSYKWEIEIGAAVHHAEKGTFSNTPGILVDFKWLKEWMQRNIHNVYDHALVLWDKDPLVMCTKQLAPLTVAPDAPLGSALPRLRMMSFNPTAENLAALVGRQFNAYLESDALTNFIELISLTVWETENSFARYIPNR